MKIKAASIAMGTVAALALGGTLPIVPITLMCPHSWERIVYDTSTGSIEPPYYIEGQSFTHILSATSTDGKTPAVWTQDTIPPKDYIPAQPIGTAKEADCYDNVGRYAKVTVPDVDFQKLKDKDASELTQTVDSTVLQALTS